MFFSWPAAGQFGSYWKGRENSIGDVGNDTPRGEDNPAAGKKKEQKKVLQSEVHIIPDDVADSLSVKQLWHETSEPHLFFLFFFGWWTSPAMAEADLFSKNSYWLKEDDLNNNK